MNVLLYEDNTAFQRRLWDRREFLDLLRLSKYLQNLDYKQRTEDEYSFVQDSFYALKGRPIVVSTDPTVLAWGEIQTQAWFKRLQSLFFQDPISRIAAIVTLAEIARHFVWDAKQDDPELQQFGQEIQELLDQLERNQSHGGLPGSHAEEGSQEGSDETGDAAEGPDQPFGQGQFGQEPSSETSNQSDRDDVRASLSSPSPPAQTKIGPKGGTLHVPTDFKTSWFETSWIEKGEQLSEAVHALHGFMGGETPPEKIDAAFKLLERYDLSHLVKLLGFARRTIGGANRRMAAAGGEFTRYSQTMWDERLHPLDMAMLAQGDIRTQVRMAEGALRKRQFEDNRPQGRGPVIVLRDETGSMSDWGKHQTAQALEIALAAAFNEEGRDLVSIAWTASDTRKCIYGEDDVKEHLSKFFNGNNTIISKALREGIAVAEEYVDGADILVVTDGIISDALASFQHELAHFRNRGGRLWVITVGPDAQQAIAFADGVVHLDQIMEDPALGELLAQVNRREGEGRIRL